MDAKACKRKGGTWNGEKKICIDTTENARYWTMELDKRNKADLLKWIKNDELEGLVDEKMGGIIAYIGRQHVGQIITKLNRIV